MTEYIKKISPLFLLIAASMYFVPVNSGQVTLAVVFMWVLGLAIAILNDRKPGYFDTTAILVGVVLAGLNIATFVHMMTWRLEFWQSFYPMALAATTSIITSMAVNKK